MAICPPLFLTSMANDQVGVRKWDQSRSRFTLITLLPPTKRRQNELFPSVTLVRDPTVNSSWCYPHSSSVNNIQQSVFHQPMQTYPSVTTDLIRNDLLPANRLFAKVRASCEPVLSDSGSSCRSLIAIAAPRQYPLAASPATHPSFVHDIHKFTWPILTSITMILNQFG